MILKQTVFTLLIALAMSGAQAQVFKKYEVKSGEVRYRISGSGEVMGAKMTEEGTKRLLFDQYGFRELTEEKSTRRTDVMGQVQTDRTDRILFRNGTKVKEVDRIRGKMLEFEPPGMALMIAAARQNLTQMGEAFMKQMGGKKIGKEKVAGYECDLWKMPVVTQCLYKGVPLKIVSNAVGMKHTEIAVEAKFDIPVDPAAYRLPDLPKENLPPEAEAMMKAMSGMAQAVRESGGGAGGEKSPASPTAGMPDPSSMVLTQMKREFLRHEKDVSFYQGCLERCRTLKEANDCEKMFSARVGGPSNPFPRWDEATKNTILRHLKESREMMECVKKAKSMGEIEKCEP